MSLILHKSRRAHKHEYQGTNRVKSQAAITSTLGSIKGCDYRVDFSKSHQRESTKKSPARGIDEAQQKFTCEICCRPYKYKATLLRHQRQEHISPMEVKMIPGTPSQTNIDTAHSASDLQHEGSDHSSSDGTTDKSDSEQSEPENIVESVTKHKCPMPGCERIYANKHSFVVHMRRVHPKGVIEQERQANSVIEPCAPQQSQPVNIIERRLKCPEPGCERRYTYKNALLGHMRNRHPKPQKSTKREIIPKPTENASDTEEEYACDKCDRTYPSKRQLKVHQKNVHEKATEAVENSMRTITCPVCGETFSNPQEIRSHKITVHGFPNMLPPDDPLICRYCDEKFENKKSLKLHTATHNACENRYPCKYCKKAFKTRTMRLEHESVHTGERHYKCPHCPKAFASNPNFLNHIRAHLQIKKYACAYCDKRFVQSGEKKIHERIHTKETPHQCEECGQRFQSSAKLRHHLRKHRNIRNYKCEHCAEAYFHLDRLQEHVRRHHTGEKPFECDVCGKAFVSKSNLRSHKFVHAAEKNYVCSICDRRYYQQTSLNLHMKSHNKEQK